MRRKKNILVLTQWSFKDPLIQAYTLPYVKIISRQLAEESRIYLVTFEQNKLKILPEERKKITDELEKNRITLIDFNYSRFGVAGFIKWAGIFLQLLSKIFSKRISYIHAWCTPAGALGYFLSIFSGRPLVIDSYEPHAEAMVENRTWDREGMKFRMLFYLEKKLSRRAVIIISATEGMHEYAERKYGIDLQNFYVKPACVDLENFNVSKRKNASLVKEFQLENKIVCVYAGKFGGIYLTKEVFDFLAEAEKIWTDRFRVLLLTPHNTDELSGWAKQSKLSPEKMIVRFVPHDVIQDYMGLGDFAITPVKPIPTKKYCTPIKDGEYWALGLPVIITHDISDDSDIIEKYKAGAVIKDLSVEGYKKSLNELQIIMNEPSDDLSKRIESLAKQFRSFDIAENIYKKIYGD